MAVRLSSRLKLRKRAQGLWRRPDFLKFWAGQTVSLFGSLLTQFALPLLAVLLLDAGAGQVALLASAEVAPGLLLGFFAGVWVDRLRRRPLLIAADIGRALALVSIPIAAALHTLRIEQLYLVAALVSVCGVFFDVAYPSYLPTLLRREDLVEGNSKLAASEALAEVSGWGVAGVLVQIAGAPLAILVDALTFVVSAVSIATIRAREAQPFSGAERRTMLREVARGLRFVVANPARRTLAAAAALDTLFGNALGTLITLYLIRDLHLAPVVMGAIYAVGGVSSFAGSLLVTRVSRRWPVGRILLGAMLDLRYWRAHRTAGEWACVAGGGAAGHRPELRRRAYDLHDHAPQPLSADDTRPHAGAAACDIRRRRGRRDAGWVGARRHSWADARRARNALSGLRGQAARPAPAGEFACTAAARGYLDSRRLMVFWRMLSALQTSTIVCGFGLAFT